MSDAAITVVVAGVVQLGVAAVAFFTLWVKLRYAGVKAEEAVVKAAAVEEKIDHNTVITKTTAASVEAVKDVVNGVAHPALITADMDGKILDATDPVLALTGFRPAELVGKNVEMLLPERYLHRHQTTLAASRASGQIRPKDVAIIGHLKDRFGAEIPVLICLVQSGGNRVTAQLVRRSELFIVDERKPTSPPQEAFVPDPRHPGGPGTSPPPPVPRRETP